MERNSFSEDLCAYYMDDSKLLTGKMQIYICSSFIIPFLLVLFYLGNFEKSNTWNIILNTAASNQKVQSLLIWIHVHLGDMRYEKVAWWRPHDFTFAQLSAALSNDQDLSC